MRSRKAFSLFAVLFFGIVVWMRVAPPVLAAVPDNDDFDYARFVSPLTYFDISDTSEATTADDDPYDGPRAYSVWYAFTPDSSMAIEGNTFGSNYDTAVAVYTGVRGALNLIVQNNDYEGLQSRVHFIGTPGTTYYFMVSACCEWNGATGGNLQFLIKALTPPPNDNFAQAAVVPAIPFDERADAFASTLEPNEPTPSCSSSGTINNSVWYAYTPQADELASVSFYTPDYAPGERVLGVYTGSDFGNLTEIGCRMSWWWDNEQLTLALQGGTTYYFQGGNPSELSEYFWFSMQPPPPPNIYYVDYYPYDPSTYDDVYFYTYAYDPAGVGITSWAWDFGDGTTAFDEYASHRYSTDGDYSVTLTATTQDGRQATATLPLSVRTRDVVITKFSTPKSGRVGQTAKIVVGVNNRMAPETVTVELLRSTPFGFYTIGWLTLYVPTHKNNRTTDFAFSYTFTPQDGEIGKVSFKAIARIESGRDALPGDNEAISFPASVRATAAIAAVEDVEMQENFLVRNDMDKNPELHDLFLLPSYWVYMPTVVNRNH